MKKINYLFALLVVVSFSVNAQIYTPSGTIQGSSGNNNVGIGLSSPSERLHLKTTGHSFLKIETNQNTRYAGLKLVGYHNGSTATSQIYMNYYGPTYHGLNYISGRNGFSNHWFRDYSGNLQMVIKNSGDIGIGLANPEKLLHLYTSGTSSKPTIRLEHNEEYHFDWDITNNAGNLEFSHATHGTFKTLLRLNEYSELMQVDGKIECEELEVKNISLPDYVFADNYNLRSLDEVSLFIELNNHLPGVPSAQEVAENGMNVTEMTNLLLEKIEELTLYTIQLQKEINDLKSNESR